MYRIGCWNTSTGFGRRMTATEAAAPAYYSYDEQAIDELDGNRMDVPFSYDEQSLADRTAAPVLSGAGGSEESEKPAPTRGIFADGFDPKMAVLYTEVMRPKFQEY